MKNPTRRSLSLLLAPVALFALEGAAGGAVIALLHEDAAIPWYSASVAYAVLFGLIGFLSGIPICVSNGDRLVTLLVFGPMVFFGFIGAVIGYEYGKTKGPDFRDQNTIVADSVFNCIFGQLCFGNVIGTALGVIACVARIDRDRAKRRHEELQRDTDTHLNHE